MKASLLFCSLFVCVLLFGCDSGTGPGGGFIATHVPAAGTTYTYTRVTIDTFGRIDPTSENQIVDSVSEAGTSHAGKDNVIQIDHYYDGSLVGYSYYNYEANGDFSEYVDYLGSPGTPMWVTYPVQSRTTKTYTLLDTTVDYFGTPTHLTSVAMISFGGITTMRIHDTTLTLVKLVLKGVNTATPDPGHISETITADFYFAPSIGYIGRMHEEPYRSIGILREGRDQTLIDYRFP